VRGGLWIAVLTNFVFWTGVSGGGVAFAALLDLTGARWPGPLRSIACRFHRFLPVSIALYLLLLAGARAIYPWIEHPSGLPWLRFGFFAVRDALALVAVTGAAIALASRPTPSTAPQRRAIVFLILYVCGFSVLAIDLLMSLAAPWGSVLFPAYVFTANVYTAIAAIAVAASWQDADGRAILTDDRACDLGKLLFGFALLWMYFVWSQFFVIWYGNLSGEVGYVMARLYGRWQPLAVATWLARFALPFVVLLPRAGKRRAPVLIVSAVIAVGFWAECFLLIAPEARQLPSVAGAAIVTAVFAALFAAATLWPTRVYT
jgi:hypothetical protein